MNKLSILFLFSLLSVTLQAQQFSLKGRVTDQHGNPVSEAKVVAGQPIQSSALTDQQGMFLLRSENPIQSILVSALGKLSQTHQVNGRTFISVHLKDSILKATPVYEVLEDAAMNKKFTNQLASPAHQGAMGMQEVERSMNTEAYAGIEENGFQLTTINPLSTFSIDVDRASYSNIRRFLNNGSLPPKDAVRVEEMINYFNYDYPDPVGEHPVAIQSSMTQAPWDEAKQLLHIGIQAKRIEKEELPPSNLVFLLDVSGSMQHPNKLPLLKSSLNILVDELREEDRVALVVYAGAAGLVLESTAGNEKERIKQAISALEAGGSTAGGAGIKLAYKEAQANFMKAGNNRIILASDGDFNVGASSDGEMKQLVEANRDRGIYLTVLGFGMGNYKDSKMEMLADHGNGNYAYIDNLSEARKTLIGEFGATLFTVAKDVKVQIEFNPAVVAEYRLIGYENRLLDEEDFNDDKKDAGEMGAGHVVTAIYEVLSVGSRSGRTVDPLRYQQNSDEPKIFADLQGEAAMVKLRYKQPGAATSMRLDHLVSNQRTAIEKQSENVRWSACIAAFGMKLRGSDVVQEMEYDTIIQLAQSSRGEDLNGYRSEAIQLMRNAANLAPSRQMP